MHPPEKKNSAIEQQNFDLTEKKESAASYKIGQFLKSAREQKCLSLESACQSLKIRKFFLENIEKGDFEKLPGAIYTIGFIKSYSAYLGIDFKELSSELAKLTMPLEKATPLGTYCLSQPKNLLTKRALWGSLLLTVACLGIYFAYYREQNETFKKRVRAEKQADLVREKAEVTRQIPVEKSLAVGADQLTQDGGSVTISANKETWIRIVDKDNQLIVARLLRPQSFYRLDAIANPT